MSRSGYHDDLDPLDLGRWRGMVASSIRGRRGQKLLSDLLAALDAMPEKRLIKNALQDENGEVCALGAVGKMRGIDMEPLDPECAEQVAPVFGVAECLAQEIVYLNDECFWHETPEERYQKVRNWVLENLKPAQPEAA